MIIEVWFKTAKSKLKKAGIGTADLDTLVLLEDALKLDRSQILAHLDKKLTDEQQSILDRRVLLRIKHTPLAYIRGKSEFYGREFKVNEHTLEPRPETETMIEVILKSYLRNVNTLVDVGTGSGCLAITAKLLFPQAKVYGTDIDKKCIQTAKANAKKHNVSIDFRQGNLLEPLLKENFKDWTIVANLPYVPDSHTINEAAMFEPKHAIFGGEDGLDYYRQMFKQISEINNKPDYIFTESLPFQHHVLDQIAKKYNFQQQQIDDFIQVFKLT